MDPVSAVTILHSVSAAVSATFTVTNTLIQISTAISEVDRSLQQLQREITDLQETMESMGQDFSGPAGKRVLESSTGNLGNHWKALLKLIKRANRTLSEMESCLRTVPHSGGGNWSRPLRAAWMRFKEGDIAYYRNEIQIITQTMHLQLTIVLVCRDMFGMSASGAQGRQVDLASTEDRWHQLKRNAINLRSSASIQSPNPYRRRPVQNSSATTLVSDEPVEPKTENEYLRQRQLETAKEIDQWLGTASDLLSTASTVCAQTHRRSFGEETMISEQKQAAVIEYLQGQRQDRQDGDLPQARMKPTNGFLVILPISFRMVGVLSMFIMSYILWGFLIVYFPLWPIAMCFIGFKNFRYHWASLRKPSAQSAIGISRHGVVL